MMKDMEFYCIREMAEEDVQEVLSCLASLSDIKGDMHNIMKNYQTRLKCGNILTYVYELHGIPRKIVGTISLVLINKLTHGGSLTILIDDVAVHKDFQGEGIGRKLIIFAKELAISLGARKIILDCSQQLTKFYEKCGFKQHDIGMRYDIMEL